MVIMIMITMIIIAVSESNCKLGPLDLEVNLNNIYDRSVIDDDDDDDYSCNSVNFEARTSRLYMEVNINNKYR